MKKQNIYCIIFLLIFGSIIAQQTPAPKQTATISIVGGTAHIGNGKILENSTIVFKNGKITYLGNEDSKKEGVVIDAKNKHIYPGFIVANTTLGLVEIDAVRASRDASETGTYLPHIRSLIAYNTESKVTETMRPNGVFIGQITPRGGDISGTSSVVQFDAWNWEDAVIKENDAIHVNWPSMYSRFSSNWFGKVYGYKPNEKYNERVDKLKSYFLDAKHYLNTNSPIKNIPFEATRGLFSDKQKVFIHVDGEQSIKDAIETFLAVGIKKIVIVGGYEAEKLAKLLKAHQVPVVLERAHRLPKTEDEAIDLPYRSAKILTDAGILVGLGMDGDMERMQTRNLPFYAGTYAAYGLGKEKALQLITENNAKILGIDKITGTLEIGKDATLFISKGDALDMRTNIISEAFIQGRKISLESHQTKLYKRYTKKYNN